MSSLHIGWALLIAFVLLRAGPRPLALVAVLYAATTVLVVVIRPTHWWLDGIIAGSLLALALVVFPRPGNVIGPRLRTPRNSTAVPEEQGINSSNQAP